MRILLTGGTGNLGSNLVEHWLPKDHELCVIDNFATSPVSLLHNVPGLVVVEGDVTNLAALDDIFKTFEPDIVVHSAAAYKDPDNWQQDANTNVIGAINVAKLAEKYQAKKIINFQTALCYGRPSQVPIPIEHPVAPFTSYGISKTAGEQFMLNASVPVVSLRLANICSPRLSIGPIPTFYQRLKQDKSCFCSDTVRDFLDISDFLSLMDIIIAQPDAKGIFNVSTGEGKSIKDVFDCVATYLGLPEQDVPIVPPGDDDVPSVVLDPSKTEQYFGWRHKVGFKEMIEKQLAWYDEHGVSSIYSHLSAPTQS